MDGIGMKKAISEFASKYKYVALILLFGLVLMSIPSNKVSDVPSETQPSKNQNSELSVSEELAFVLEQIDGAGKVDVMLTVALGEETIYQSDVQSDITSDNGSNTNTTTVIITDTDRAQQGLIRQINPAKYMGAIVVCEGADDPSVVLSIVEAVSKVTGLTTDRISVLKMK